MQRLAVCLVAATALVLLAPSAPAAAVTRWGVAGSGPGQLASPWAIAARDDRVYVAEFDNDRIQVFNRGGIALFAFGSSGPGAGQLRGPAGIALDRQGRVWVADFHNHRIQRFSADGEFQLGWPVGDADAAPLGVAVDDQGRVYAGDLVAGRIRVWLEDGSLVSEWGGLREPWGITLDARGDLWVADHGAHQIVRFGPRGEPRGILDVPSGALDGPMGVAIAADGSLIVSDLAGTRLHRVDPAGSRFASFDDPGGSGGLITGLASAGGEVFATDAALNQIVRVGSLNLGAPGATAFHLASIGPSPSHGTVLVRFAAPTRGALGMQVFSIAGCRLWSSPPREIDAGENHIEWSGHDERGRPVPAGIYFIRLSFDDGVQRVTRDGRAVVIR